MIRLVEDYNYWKECISQFIRAAKDNPAQYSYGKLEKLIFEFCVDVTVHYLRLVMKYLKKRGDGLFVHVKKIVW